MRARQDDSPSELTPATPLPTSSGPTVLRMGLGIQLRSMREKAGLTQDTAGYAIRASAAKISRLELGRVRFKERDIADLLTLYGIVNPDERYQLLRLGRQANAPGWWHQYGDLLPDWFETYLGLEQASSVIRIYECQFVPGLLQTPDYARAVTRLGLSDPVEVERRVEMRLRRQNLLDSPDAPKLWTVIDEAALRRTLVGPELRRAQLDHLIAKTERPNIQIQIAPLANGGHPAAAGSFTILRFAERDLPDIVYLEHLTSAIYLDKRADVDHYAAVMNRLCAQVESPDATGAILEEIRDQL